MTTTQTAPSPTIGPDLAAIKIRQQATWASGDYAAVGARIHSMAEHLAEAADLAADSTVLDVATGSGNGAIAAARLGCRVTGIDYVPGLLDRTRARAEAEGLEIEFLDGDAEALPFADGEFDAVLSVVGVMFATDQDRAASELLRVTRPGGRIALANWTPSGFVGEMLETVGRHVPPPTGVASPLAWGTIAGLCHLLGAGLSELYVRPREFVFRFASSTDYVEFFRANYGPVHMAFERLDAGGREALARDLAALATRHDRATGSGIAVPSEYAEVIATRGQA
jgi:SAM-dependent methyltransferase